MIKYMKTFGLDVNNDIFENHSWYFRNALVRANYNDWKNGIHATTKFLEQFFSNLLMGTAYELKNRYMHLDYVEETQSVNFELPKCQIDTLECTLEEFAILQLIDENKDIKQNEIAKRRLLTLLRHCSIIPMRQSSSGLGAKAVKQRSIPYW